MPSATDIFVIRFASMKNLEKLRKQRGITQIQLARKLRMEQSNVSKWENGMTLARPATIKKVANILKCRVEDLI